MHEINYTGESKSIDFETSKQIADAVEAWDDGNATQFGGFAFDKTNQGMRISLRVAEVDPTDISAELSGLDTFLEDLNKDHGSSFPPASGTADIQPEQG